MGEAESRLPHGNRAFSRVAQALLGILLAALAAPACSDRGTAPGGPCVSSADCAPGFVCDQGACLAPCTAGLDCGSLPDAADALVGHVTDGQGADAWVPPCLASGDCSEDGYCNPACVDLASNIPTDSDCNPNTPENSNKFVKNPACSCDYWGFVCETTAKCTTAPCECDPDCQDVCEGGLLPACRQDGFCDTWCSTNSDPDCAGTPNDGTFCGGGGDACTDFGCGRDGICNFDCDSGGDPTDPDCNPNTPDNSTFSKKNPDCSCDYWGFLCEAGTKCSFTACECDPDCKAPAGCVAPIPCTLDGHCDTWCPKNEDPDCSGANNGMFCGAPDCNMKPGECNAKKGTTTECPGDPDCDGIDLPCESDGYCDTNCSAGADPDC